MKKYLNAILVGCSTLGILACGSDTDNEGETGYESIYVAEEGQSGRFSMRVSRTSLEVGETTSFHISARDRNGGPVTSMSISCTTEPGLLVTEPVGDFGLTNDDGNFSGQVACLLPGSWRILCRARSAAWEEHETIKCAQPAVVN